VGGIYGTQFWIDPANRVVGLVMTRTAIIGSGPISNPIREAFYTAVEVRYPALAASWHQVTATHAGNLVVALSAYRSP